MTETNEIWFDLKLGLKQLDTMETEQNNARFPNLEEGDLDETDEERNEKSTMKSTKWGLKLLKEWCQEKAYSEDSEQLDVPELAFLLVWGYVEYHFCRWDREDLRRLKKPSFGIDLDDQNKEYVFLKFNKATQNHPGDLQDNFQSCKGMFATGDDKCPVQAIKKYLPTTKICDGIIRRMVGQCTIRCKEEGKFDGEDFWKGKVYIPVVHKSQFSGHHNHSPLSCWHWNMFLYAIEWTQKQKQY